MGERDRIARFFTPLTAGESGSFNLTDDAAVLTPPAGQQLVITTDSVIEGIHVLANATPQQFAQKLMRRNLSDLAAMGATPWRYTLNLHTPPGVDDDWFAAFAATLAAEQTTFGMVLIGGDSTTGGSTIHTTMTCMGLLEVAPLRRAGAQAGDDIYISGTLGGAAYALTLLQKNKPIDAALAARYHCPEPRLALGQMLHGIATATIDISDGLVADITQLCAASHCGAVIQQNAIPLDHHFKNAALDAAATYHLALSGGDDYELCFTAPSSNHAAIEETVATLKLPITRIGNIVAGKAVTVMDATGSPVLLKKTGWEH